MPMAYLCLKPKTEIPIYFSAMGERSAYIAGKYADRLTTVANVQRFKEVILPNFERGCTRSWKRSCDNRKSRLDRRWSWGS